MKRITIEPTFEGWRTASRGLLAAGTDPRDVLWETADEAQPALGLVEEARPSAADAQARVPRA
ncbi:MAG TPA: hypothetical protein VE913_08580, partial [Longimicrobium sp.]|nr:hypothetical protein [Longimicrobium sp.]